MARGIDDLTGWCESSQCSRCDGVLHTGHDWHWFCACPCHPEPKRDGKNDRAVKVWEQASKVWR